MKTIISFIIVLLSGIFLAHAQELDGKTFDIKLKIIKGKKNAGLVWTEDNLSFEHGELTTAFMSKREQFPPAPCEIKVDSSSGKKVITFSAAHKNPGGSTIKWEGSIKGDNIEGTTIWKNMQGPRTYSFTGTIKGKK